MAEQQRRPPALDPGQLQGRTCPQNWKTKVIPTVTLWWGPEVSEVEHRPHDGQILLSSTLGMAAKDYHQPGPITDPDRVCQPPAQAPGVQSFSWSQVLKTSLVLPAVLAALACTLIRKILPRSLHVCLRSSSGDSGLGWQRIYIMIGLRLVKF